MSINYQLDTDPQWLKNAFSDLGIHEEAGTQLNNQRILEMFQTAGHPEVKDDETAWCSAAMNTWFIEAGYKGTGSLMAQSWKTWGKDLGLNNTAPRGAVVVFYRGSKSSGLGHVAIVLDDDGKYITHIGGNQSDSVCVSRTPRSRVLALRWPNTVANSGTIKAVAGSTVALTSSQGLDTASNAVSSDNGDFLQNTLGMAQPYVEQLSHILHWAVYASAGLGIALAFYAAYRHYQAAVKA